MLRFVNRMIHLAGSYSGKLKIARVFSQLSSIYGLSRPSASM